MYRHYGCQISCQIMNCKKFTFDYKFRFEDFFPPCVDIEAYKEAAVNLFLPPDWREKLDRLNRVRAVHGTTALEGNPLSESEVSHKMELLDQQGDTPTVSHVSKAQ